jgi:putrescine transport system substrate-binding protein
MLLDLKVVSRFAACGVGLLDTPTEAIPAALTYLGRAPQAQTPDSLAEALDVLWNVRPHVREVSSNSRATSALSSRPRAPWSMWT